MPGAVIRPSFRQPCFSQAVCERCQIFRSPAIAQLDVVPAVISGQERIDAALQREPVRIRLRVLLGALFGRDFSPSIVGFGDNRAYLGCGLTKAENANLIS
jgi:hypothetical protein